MLLPLLGMLFVAIWVRIADYGITELRYYVMAMASGLALVVFYFIFSKAKDIRIIPIVVFSIAILSAFGPWGAFAVSKASQQNRMEAILIENGMLLDGKIVPSETELKLDVKKDLNSITSYLIGTHGKETFDRWLDDSTMKSLDTLSRASQEKELTKLMGFNFYKDLYNFGSGKNKPVVLRTEGEIATKITGYDYFLDLDADYLENRVNTFTYNFEDDTILLTFSSEESSLRLFSLVEHERILLAEIELKTPIAALMKKYTSGGVTDAEFTFERESKDFDIKFYFHRVFVKKSDDEFTISSIQCQVFLRKR